MEWQAFALPAKASLWAKAWHAGGQRQASEQERARSKRAHQHECDHWTCRIRGDSSRIVAPLSTERVATSLQKQWRQRKECGCEQREVDAGGRRGTTYATSHTFHQPLEQTSATRSSSNLVRFVLQPLQYHLTISPHLLSASLPHLI